MINFVIFLVCVLITGLLYNVELHARDDGLFFRYAWLTRLVRQVIAFAGIAVLSLKSNPGQVICEVFTDNQTLISIAYWAASIGIMAIGLALAIWTAIHRKDIQDGLRRGTVDPFQ